jgi:hypothetical protein
MWQTGIFGAYWKHEGRTYYDEFPADSKGGAEEYFNDHKRDDVTLVRVEKVRSDDNGVREPAVSPCSPFSPLIKWRRTDKDEDAR